MKDKPIIIIGAGGHALVLIDILRLNGREIIGATDPNIKKGNFLLNNIMIIGDDSEILNYKSSDIEIVNGLGPSIRGSKRKDLTNSFTKAGYTFSKVIHPSSVIASNAKIAAGTQIMAGAIIQSKANIEFDSVINTGAIIDHDCHIMKHAHIAPGATLCGNVHVGNDVFVGANSVVIESIKLEDGATVGAGVTVRKNVSKNELYVGKT